MSPTSQKMTSKPNSLVIGDPKSPIARIDTLGNAPYSDAPLCLLMGFTGSNFAALDRYAKSWSERGFHVCVIPGRFRLGLSFSLYDVQDLERDMRELAVELVGQFPGHFKRGEHGNAVVAHLFSNGGAHSLFVLGRLLDGMSGTVDGEKPSLKSTKLLVLDSSPNVTLVGDTGVLRQFNPTAISALAHFFVPILGFKIPPSPLPRSSTLLLASGSVVAASLIRAACYVVAPSMVSNMGKEMVQGLENGDLKVAERLYLCGDADEICSVDEIRGFAEKEGERLGKKPTIVVFKGTGHVAHAPKWRAEYWAAIDRGLERARIAARSSKRSKL